MDTSSDQNVQYKTITGTIFGVVFANIAVALRLLARRVGGIRLKVDDYLMLVALAFHWSIAAGGIIMLRNGLGLPITATPPDRLVVFFKTQYAGSFLYTLCVAFTKISILCMYWRVFACREVQRLVLFGFFAVGGWAIATCVAGGLMCLPMERMWDPTIPGACIDIAAFYYGIQIPNILTDIYIVVVPIHQIFKLDLTKGQQYSLVGIFGLATLTVAFDIVRLVSMIELSESTEPITIAVADATIWTCVEPGVGIMAACLANMRPLYNWLIGRFRYARAERMSSKDVSQATSQVTNSTNPLTTNPTTLGSMGTVMYASSETEANIFYDNPFRPAEGLVVQDRPGLNC